MLLSWNNSHAKMNRPVLQIFQKCGIFCTGSQNAYGRWSVLNSTTVMNVYFAQKQWICEVCGKVLHNYETFRSHKRRQHCTQLPERTATRLTSKAYPQLRRLMCEVCGLRSKDCSAFARHMRNYHPSSAGVDNSSAPYRCPWCTEKFLERRILTHHVQLVHVLNLPRSARKFFKCLCVCLFAYNVGGFRCKEFPGVRCPLPV